MSSVRHALRGTLTLLLALSIAGCGDDDTTMNGGNGGSEITLPASWGGTWQITSQPATPLGSGTEVSLEMLCGGSSLEDLFGDLGEIAEFGTFSCSGTWTDAAADVQCDASVSFKGCTANWSMVLDVTRSGDTFMGTQTVAFFSEPDNCAGLPETIAWDIMGVRMDTDQTGCDPGLAHYAPASWGGTWDVTETPVGRGSAGGTLICPDQTSIEDILSESSLGSTTGGFTDTSVEAFISWTTVEGPCAILHSERLDVTRNGDSFTGTRQSTTTQISDPNQGETCSEMTTVTDYQVTGTRISSDVSGCVGPAAAPVRDPELSDFRLF